MYFHNIYGSKSAAVAGHNHGPSFAQAHPAKCIREGCRFGIRISGGAQIWSQVSPPSFLLEEKRREDKLAVAPPRQEGGRAARFSPLPLPVALVGRTCLFSSLHKELLCNCCSSLVGWIQTCGARQRVLPQDLFPCRLWSSSCESAH